MNIGIKFAKYVLFFFNLLFAMLGLAMFVWGFFVEVVFLDHEIIIAKDMIAIPMIFIVVGSILFFVAFLGCCGAIIEQPVLLGCYLSAMIILVGLEVGIICAVYSMRNELDSIIDMRLNYTIHHSIEMRSFYATWEEWQMKLNCCGINGPNDWENVLPNGHLPYSCCPNMGGVCHMADATQTGCKSAFNAFMNSHFAMIIRYVTVAAVFQFLAIIFPCWLLCGIRKNKRPTSEWQRFQANE